MGQHGKASGEGVGLGRIRSASANRQYGWEVADVQTSLGNWPDQRQHIVTNAVLKSGKSRSAAKLAVVSAPEQT
jgi:hypothetical protein